MITSNTDRTGVMISLKHGLKHQTYTRTHTYMANGVFILLLLRSKYSVTNNINNIYRETVWRVCT